MGNFLGDVWKKLPSLKKRRVVHLDFLAIAIPLFPFLPLNTAVISRCSNHLISMK